MAFEAFYSATAVRPPSRLAFWLSEAVTPPGRALDIGCGAGVDAAFLAKLGFEVDAIEPNPSAQTLAVPGSISRAGVADFEAAPATYRAILCSNVLPFLFKSGEIESALRRISSLLAPGGAAAISLFGERDSWANLPHIRVVPSADAEGILAAAGLAVLKKEEVERDQKPVASDVEKHWHILRFLCGRKVL